MPWFKVDDKLHDHHKTRAAGPKAMGVWVLAGSWCADNMTDGFLPESVLRRWGTPADAKRLVDAGYWTPCEANGEKGWRFHDWAEYQPLAAATRAKRESESAGGVRGNHVRWHQNLGVTDLSCELCRKGVSRASGT